MVQRPVIAVDIETTAVSPSRGARIIELGAVVVEEGCIGAEFSSLLDPAVPISRAAQRVHGITQEMLVGKSRPEDVLPEFRRFIKRRVLVAHNASFDISFLRYEFGRLGLGFHNPYHCTLALSRRRFTGLANHKLETVYRHLFGAPPVGTRSHRALDDARMVARVWMELNKTKI